MIVLLNDEFERSIHEAAFTILPITTTTIIIMKIIVERLNKMKIMM